MTDRLPYVRGLVLHLAAPTLLGISVGLLRAEIRLAGIDLPLEALDLAAASLIGLLSGLSARSLLRGWMVSTRLVLALASLPVWMAAFEASYYASHIIHPSQVLQPPTMWTEIGQLALGVLSLATALLIAGRTRQPPGIVWVYTTGAGAPAAHPRRSPVAWGLGLSLFAAVLLGAGVGLLQANAAALPIALPPLAIPLIGAGVTGLVAGTAARVALQGWREGVRILTTLLALLVWIVAAELATASFSGADPLSPLAADNIWIEIGQLAVGLQAAVVAGMGRRLVPDADPTLALLRATAPQRSTSRSRLRTTRRTPTARPRRAPRWGRRKRRVPQVRVLTLEEERCPYCLGLIEPGSRDAVRCPICGTPHHADCWEAGGGKCQVPHLIM
jgi:hypothetical protein